MDKENMKHGLERKQIISTENGHNLTFTKREKFCVFHGWVDLFIVGGELNWRQIHGKCDQRNTSGAEFENFKVMKKAA